MRVSERIEQAPACPVINLADDELDVYRGAGWRLARFEGGRLVELFDPTSKLPAGEADAKAKRALDRAIDWLSIAHGEAWLVMCSAYQLCDPHRVSLTDAAALARMARAFGEQLAETR